MKKSDWQYLVDTLLFISMFGIAFIGILMGFFLAEGLRLERARNTSWDYIAINGATFISISPSHSFSLSFSI